MVVLKGSNEAGQLRIGKTGEEAYSPRYYDGRNYVMVVSVRRKAEAQ